MKANKWKWRKVYLEEGLSRSSCGVRWKLEWWSWPDFFTFLFKYYFIIWSYFFLKSILFINFLLNSVIGLRLVASHLVWCANMLYFLTSSASLTVACAPLASKARSGAAPSFSATVFTSSFSSDSRDTRIVWSAPICLAKSRRDCRTSAIWKVFEWRADKKMKNLSVSVLYVLIH